MHLTAQLKLKPTEAQAVALRRTLGAFNSACDYISGVAWTSRTFRQFDIHKLCYREARNRFGLSAQAAVRAISKVADAYRLDRNTRRTFRPMGSAAYDGRILRYQASAVSIWTIEGRLSIPFVCGDSQRALLEHQNGESDLAFMRGKWYLMATCEVATAPPPGVSEFIGLDLGITQIASDSDGNQYSGSQVKSVRYRHRRLRTKLQKKQTRSAKRRLKKLSGKESRFAKHVNHVISKQIVASAEGTGRGIALEELKGIRERITVSWKQRAVLHSWAFSQLRLFVTYKAQRAGVPIVLVDPKNTSRECSRCGHIAKENRPSQAKFRCVSCGHEANADFNAALVIRGRAIVSAPNVASCAAG